MTKSEIEKIKKLVDAGSEVFVRSMSHNSSAYSFNLFINKLKDPVEQANIRRWYRATVLTTIPEEHLMTLRDCLSAVIDVLE